MHYDVFNGDADGICALHQLRLSQPLADARLITGVKRDITLLSAIADVTESTITVLDVSLDSNRNFLDRLLLSGNTVVYFDHHYAGDIPDSAHLAAHIDTSADLCTSLIVNSFLHGKYCKWAICGAFGDNLNEIACKAASSLNLSVDEISRLREVGELLNYNGYGATLDDLFFDPADLYRSVREFENPLDFHASSESIAVLRKGLDEDMAKARAVRETGSNNGNRIYFFPDAPWSRRIAGIFSNLKSRERTDKAHAVIIANDDTTYRISVRAPLDNRKNADTLCRKFPTGGGRAAAAGINNLPAKMLDNFLAAINRIYP